MISDRAKRAGLKELDIFDYFEVDQNLPKHQKDSDNKVEVNEGWGTTPQAWISVDNSTSGDNFGTVWVNGTQLRTPLMRRFKDWVISKLQSTRQAEEKRPKKLITVIDFFTQLSKSYKELTPIADIAEHYEKALVQAKTMGQTALLQRLTDVLDMVRSEAHLIAMGIRKYVTEKQVVTFYEKVGEDKNLKLTWIKNFNRIIPEDIYTLKKNIDERKLFDNYVVLHYDPANNGEKMTKEEIEKKKDPILFGVMKNSRKLYYVADWKDEYCDLTLEEMFKTLKGRVLQINNKTVKTFIDKTKV